MELPFSASVPIGPSFSARKREATAKADAAESDDFVSGFSSSDDTGGANGIPASLCVGCAWMVATCCAVKVVVTDRSTGNAWGSPMRR